jgi:hypothetical protein
MRDRPNYPILDATLPIAMSFLSSRLAKEAMVARHPTLPVLQLEKSISLGVEYPIRWLTGKLFETQFVSCRVWKLVNKSPI